MTRALLSALSLCVFSSLFSNALGGPACSKRFQNSECVQLCKPGWGFAGKPDENGQAGPGMFMGSDPWGIVISKSGKSLDEWIASACGVESTSSSSAPAPESSQAATSSTSSAAAPSSSSSSSAAPTTSSSSSSSSSSFSPTSTSTTETPTSTSEPPPPPPPTTTTSEPPPPPPPPTTTSEEPKPAQTEAPKIAGGAVSGGGGGGGSSGSDQEEWLSAHNSLRASHGAGSLTWSDEAASKAQEWANNCVFEHSGGSLGPFGENLAAGTGDSYNVQSAFKSWADEEKDFNPGSPKSSHYTQVVWKGSTQVGCAFAMCDGIFDASFGKSKYYVCEYSPQGNVVGAFGENVQ